jgi:hypothetical protein
MEALDKAAAVAQRVMQLAQRLIDRHKPGAILEEQPEYHEMKGLLEKGQKDLQADLDRLTQKARAQAAETSALAERLKAEQEAMMAQVARPPAPPLPALEFAEKHTPAQIQGNISRLLQLAKLPPHS